MIFELTLKGFDPTTDETDHLVKWLVAPTEEVANRWINSMGLRDSIFQEPIEIYHGETLDFCNGIDVKIGQDGYSKWPKGRSLVGLWARESAEATA